MASSLSGSEIRELNELIYTKVLTDEQLLRYAYLAKRVQEDVTRKIDGRYSTGSIQFEDPENRISVDWDRFRQTPLPKNDT